MRNILNYRTLTSRRYFDHVETSIATNRAAILKQSLVRMSPIYINLIFNSCYFCIRIMFNYIVSNMCFISSKIYFSAFQILSLSQGRPGWMRFHSQQRATLHLTTVLISLLPTHSEALTQTLMRLSGILSSPMSRKNFMPTHQTQGTRKRRKLLVLQSQSGGVRLLMTIGTKPNHCAISLTCSLLW
jgi:hypothetical protein